MTRLRCSFDTYLLGDLYIVLIDRDMPGFASVTNDADAVITSLTNLIPGGIGKRRVVYQDSDKRFDEILVDDGTFMAFRACTASQQAYFVDNLPNARLIQ